MPLQNKRYQILFHLIGWIAFIGFQLVLFPKPEKLIGNQEAVPFIIEQIVINGICIVFFYLNYFLLIPRLYFKRKYLVYLISVLCLAGMAVPAIQRLQAEKHAPDAIPVNEHGIPEFSENPLAPPTPAKSTPPRPLIEEKLLVYGNFAIKFILTFLLSLGLRIYGRWQTAEEEKYKAELSFLKAQINPHFLFNTLNGIYVMAIKKSDKTAGAIMKLSSIMRYVINEGHHEFVPLEKEINYITDYVELQKMRLASNIHLNLDIRVPNTSYRIVPLLLIPFIENAFKHGISTEKDCTILIQLLQKEKELSLMVENDKIHATLKDEEKSGIGVENTKQRLQLLYEGKHDLKITETSTTYKVSLKIILT